MSIEPAGFQTPNTGYKYVNPDEEVNKANGFVRGIKDASKNLRDAYKAEVPPVKIGDTTIELNKNDTLNPISGIMSDDLTVPYNWLTKKNDPAIAGKNVNAQR